MLSPQLGSSLHPRFCPSPPCNLSHPPTTTRPHAHLLPTRSHPVCSYARGFWHQCAVGFSGVVFGLIVVDNHVSGVTTRRCPVPAVSAGPAASQSVRTGLLCMSSQPAMPPMPPGTQTSLAAECPFSPPGMQCVWLLLCPSQGVSICPAGLLADPCAACILPRPPSGRAGALDAWSLQS